VAKKNEDDGSLKRLGGGRWQTRDERFSIEPQSGTWVVLDAQQTDDLGLPLVRGPFSSLTAAKGAIEGARTSEPAVSPLAAQLEEHRKRPVAAPAPAKPAGKPAPKPPPKPGPPAEPKWILDLTPDDRRRANALIDRLEKAGLAQPEDLARREIADDQAAVAALAVARAIRILGPNATPDMIARLLANGEAKDLGVSWRLVDGDGRPIMLEEVET
jgi:hypothetical protein